MLSRFDDFPIHQTPEPVAHPASSDKDFYERYWFNGYSRAGDLYLGVGTALYPHLGLHDCGISVVHGGVQYAFHASARSMMVVTTGATVSAWTASRRHSFFSANHPHSRLRAGLEES